MTRFTELVGCRLPLQLAAMGGVGTVELAAAVAGAGGLGMLPGLAAEPAVERLRRAGAAGVVGVNFLAPFLWPGAVAEVAADARVVELFFGDPDPELVDVAHDAGALVSWQVGSVDEARQAADAGCDLVVAQGVEAGGHVRGTVGLLPLLDGVMAAVDVPVVAAGGIGTAAGVAAALAAGADAVRIGTRFLATVEADVHPDYVAALVDAGPADTILTTAFHVGWPDAPHRVLRRAVEAAEAREQQAGAAGLWSPLPPTRDTPGDVSTMALYAGQGVGAVDKVEGAADVARALVEGAVARLRRVSSGA
jgi:NAD(P)H-dependent flavin oxidoreductase YrpB (nitropropane dioxygenase family)